MKVLARRVLSGKVRMELIDPNPSYRKVPGMATPPPVGSRENPLPPSSRSPNRMSEIAIRHWFVTPEGRPSIRFFEGDCWSWEGRSWVRRTRDWLYTQLTRITTDAWYANQEGELKRLDPSASYLKDLAWFIERMRSEELKGRRMPILDPNPEGLDVKKTVAFQNSLVGAYIEVVSTEEGPEEDDHIAFPTTVRDESWFDYSVLPCDWNPLARCPRWMKCLKEWGNGDYQWEKLLQMWMGYCLLSDRSRQRWMLFQGKVRAGKGTIAGVIKALIGDQAYSGTSMASMAGRFGLAGIRHSRVIGVGEIQDLDTRDGETFTANLKMIVGQDPTAVDIKYRDAMENIVIPAAVIMLSNQIPVLPDKGEGLSSKMLVLPFENSFLGREDFNLLQYLTANELEGIAAWAFQGAMDVVNGDPWPVPDAAVKVVRRFHLHNRPIDNFLEARFEKDPVGFVSSQTLWGEWQDWLLKNEVRLHVPRNMLKYRLEHDSTWPIYPTLEGADKIPGLSGLRKRDAAKDEV